MGLKREARRVVNGALGVFDLELVKRKDGVLRWFEQSPARPQAMGAPTNADSTSQHEQVPFGMVVPTVYGPVIVNRHDINQTDALIKTGRAFHHDEIQLLCAFLKDAPPGAVCLDVGANVGLYALAFARALQASAGVCHAFEAQRVFAAMVGGTMALNGILNLHVHHLAIGDRDAHIPIPNFDYDKELNFGSVEFGGEQRELLSQRPDATRRSEMVKQTTIDALELTNVRMIKVDIEGMEEQALIGAVRTIKHDLPVLCVEWIKSDKDKLAGMCKALGYEVFEWGSDLLCQHPDRAADYPVHDLPRL